MAKVTSKLQLTVPKAIADQYGIRPGDELDWVPAGETIRVVLSGHKAKQTEDFTVAQRLELFDKATERHRKRDLAAGSTGQSRQKAPASRGWTRQDAYTRDRSR
jgi:AbrB family looped-hinge helix DNA binding protein